MRLVNKIIFVNFLFAPIAALSSDWIALSQDDQSRVFISVDPLDKVSPREVRVQVKSVYTNQRDLMGLSYNVSKNEYLYSCESNLALEKQQFLFNDEELVWTFPKVINPEKINIKMPDEPLKVACN
jgi:hypothetical protein